MTGHVVGHVTGQTRFGHVTFPRSRASEVLESRFVTHSRMKHVNIRAHFICDCVNKCIIDVHHIPGTENITDLLTVKTHCVTNHDSGTSEARDRGKVT